MSEMCTGFSILLFISFLLFLSFLTCSALGRFRTDRTLCKFTKVKCTNRGSNSIQNPYWNDSSVVVESVLVQIGLAVV